MIDHYSFGKIVISGTTYTSDVKIINNQVVAGWWRKSGHAVDGDDVRDILAEKPDFLVLGTGKPGLMKASSGLTRQLKKLGIKLIEEPSDKAAQTVNRLSEEGRTFAAGFHLTC